MLKILLILTISLGLATEALPNEQAWEMASPDGSIRLVLTLESAQLTYALLKNDKSILKNSKLGVLREDTDLGKGLYFSSKSELLSLRDTVHLLTGKQVSIHQDVHSQNFRFKNAEGKYIEVQCKMFNDGVAFRYFFPQDEQKNVTIVSELTEFNFANRGEAWLQPYDVSPWAPSYEKNYYKGIPMGTDSPFGFGWCFPALFKCDTEWVLISEGGAPDSYVGSHLDNESNSKTYKIRFAELGEANGLGSTQPVSSIPFQSTWKTISVGSLNDIVRSDIVKLVSEESEFDDTAWIKPGRASWSWLSDHSSPQDYDKLVSFVDLAAEMHWEYSLVDANWNMMKGGNVEQLIKYAEKKGVGILLWYNSGGNHNDIDEEPKNIINNQELREKEFKKLQKLGVKGLKIDFFQSDKPFIMQLYKDILEDAMKYELMVNFHGCTIPRGWSRKYPNLMTMESVKGAECYTFDKEYPPIALEINTIVPFTRNVVGSMDYTPVIFSDMKHPHFTSYGHELALAVIFESGWLHFGDAVKGYKTLPKKVKKYLQEIPVVWDEIQLLSGYPGKDVVIARRKGSEWFIAGINGEDKHKSLDVDLSFLQKEYNVLSIVDGENSNSFKISTMAKPEKLKIEMLPYGGFSLRLTDSSKLTKK